ncbi:gephyrin-like molybdotransferase Glp [Natronospirillum operosum]|nr:gephyrin-like molybdotransferase Glp [Natronospirillum operosum]
MNTTITPEVAPECCSGPALMAPQQAWALLQRRVRALTETEPCALHAATGRTLARPVRALAQVPPFANSAMDGYAIGPDVTAHDCLNVVGRALAGHPWGGTLKAGEAVRIMTGAPVPAGTHAVVMQEHVAVDGERILLEYHPEAGQNIRPAGDDVQAGQALLTPGEVIGAAQIGLLAAAGVATVTVYRRPRIALLSTGDELREPGQPLGAGQIYDTNRALLHSLLHTLPVEITDFGILPDDPAILAKTLTEAAAGHDLILSSGGVSVGDTDHTRQVLERLGDIGFWKLSIKPGKPLAFGQLDQAWFFGLPGNPVSALVTAYLFMLPALRQLAGQGWHQPPQYSARATAPFRKKPGRTDYQRARLNRSVNGHLLVSPCGPQGSHQLSVLATANAFAVLPGAAGSIPEGDLVTVLPFPQTLTGLAL